MSLKQETSAPFLDLIKQYYQKNCATKKQIFLQTEAWARFLKMGLPDKKQSNFHYFPLEGFYKKLGSLAPVCSHAGFPEIRQYIYPEASSSYLVFIDGIFYPELSNLSGLPNQVVFLSLEEAEHTYKDFLSKKTKEVLDIEKDPFALLSLAMAPKGFFMYFPPKTSLLAPIQVISLTTHPNVCASVVLQVFLGSFTKVPWISTSIGPGVHLPFFNVFLEENSSLEHYDLPNFFSGEEWNLGFLRSSLKQGSCLKQFYLAASTGIRRRSLHASLIEPQAEVLLQGLWNLKGSSQAHINVCVNHQAPFTTSLQKFKGVLSDFSQSSFNGKIDVNAQAQKTNAYQMNHNLLLSPYARVHTKPNLEILADDVKASHGATVSQVDQEQLFYLKSRGLSASAAQKLLIQGFIQDMIYPIPIRSIQKEIKAYVFSSF